MPDWLKDINSVGSISSIAGLVVTIFLLIEARAIRQSFLRRARLPEVNKELIKTTSQISNQLKAWNADKSPALESLSRVKALLENVQTKLPAKERKKVQEFLAKLQPKKYFILKSSVSDLTEDSAWAIYTDLSGIITCLDQFAKDSKWD